MWRIVLNGTATLAEIERYWSLKDVLEAHEALDVKEECEEWESVRREREAPKT